MPWTSISNTVPQYSRNAGGASASGYYLKAYADGTTTPINMAVDASGNGQIAKAQLDSLGYPLNGSSAIFIPYVNENYKLALYENATDADNNTLASAVWVVDSIEKGSTEDSTASAISTAVAAITTEGVVKEFATLASAIADTGLVDGEVINLKERIAGNEGGGIWDVVLASSVTTNTYNIVACTGVATLAIVLRPESGVYNVKQFGALGDGVQDDTAAIQEALDTGRNIEMPEGTYVISGTGLKFMAARQTMKGKGLLTAINYTGAGTGVDFDGWAGCAVEDLLVYSTSAAVGINIQPNSGLTRFAHWWRLNRVMVVGTTPDWTQTDLGSAIEGFSTAGIRVERSYYGNADNCEASWCDGVGFLGLNEHNANNYQNCQTRNCNIGVKWDGSNASNGSTWTGGAIENAIGTETAGIFIGESDRNNFVGTRMECSYGTHVVIDPATGTLAQENHFTGVICGGTAPSYQIGDGTGTSEVKGTTITGGRAAGSITINSDAVSTRIEMSPTAAAAITLTDNGYGSIIHIDPNTADRWYERAVNANTNATNVNRQIAGGSVEMDYNDSYLNMSFTDLASAFRFENVNAGGTELAIFRMGAYRLWVNPGDGKLYISGATPTTPTNGTVVGTQT